MKNKAVKIGIIASIVPHIFCCGLPIALSVIGLIAPDAAHFHLIPHEWEPFLFVISGGMLAFSWYMVAQDCKCDKCDGKSHRVQRIIMMCITLLFILSLVLHFIGHNH